MYKLILVTVLLCAAISLSGANKHEKKLIPVAILYKHKHYKEPLHMVTSHEALGCFELEDKHKDEVSSIKILGDITLKVYPTDNCRGKGLRISESVPDLGVHGYNDVIRSYKKRHLKDDDEE